MRGWLSKSQLGCLLIAAYILSPLFSLSQQASGETRFNSSVCCFSGFSWTINYGIVYNENRAKAVVLRFKSNSLSVANYKYQTDGKQLSPSDVGMSRWPQETVNDGTLFGDVVVLYRGQVAKTFNNYQLVRDLLLCTFDKFDPGGKDPVAKAYIGSIKISENEFNPGSVTVRITNVTNGGIAPGTAEISRAISNQKAAAEKAKPETNQSTSMSIGMPSAGSSTQSSSNASTNNISRTNNNTSSSNYSGSGNTSTAKTNTTNANQPWTQQQVQDYLDRDAASRKAKEDAIAAKSRATGAVIESIGNFFADRARQKQQEEYQRTMANIERERVQEEKEAAERERREYVLSARQSLLNYGNGAVPLSSKKIAGDELFFFSFSYTGDVENNATPVSVSDVFSVTRYADGTWPFTANLKDDISRTNRGIKVELSGYYLSAAEAQGRRSQFLSFLQNAELPGGAAIKYKRNNKSAGSANTDFWGNEKKSGENKTTEPAPAKVAPEQQDKADFWGNPLKPVEKKEAKTAAPKGGTDFWGNPIKQENEKPQVAEPKQEIKKEGVDTVVKKTAMADTVVKKKTPVPVKKAVKKND